MLYTVTTNTDIQIIKNEIQEKAKEVGFGVLKEYSFKDILKEKGYPIEKDITVFEVCNPVTAQQVLSKYPEVSVYLPCRISLYMNDGSTVLSTVELGEILGGFTLDDDTKEKMTLAFSNLKKLLNSWQ